MATPAFAARIAAGKTNVRIVMLVHNTIGRGTFNRAHSLGRHLVRRGHEVTLFAGASRAARAKRRDFNGVRVVEAFDPLGRRARESGLSPFDLATRLRYFLRTDSVDLIHSFDHRPTVSLPALLFSRRKQAPCLFDWADLWGFDGIAAERALFMRFSLGSIDHWLEDSVRRRADGLTVINTRLRDRAQQHFAAPILLLPVGANCDLIQPLPKKEMRRRFGLPEEAPIAVHAGLSPYDIGYLADSFLELVRQCPRALLVTAGGTFPRLEQSMASAGFSSQLVRLETLERDALAALLACADVLLLPYTNRDVNLFRYPNKLGDYLCAARPIVTNATGDLGTLVARERVGLIADDTPQAFAQAVKQIFDDRDLAHELGVRGRALAESKLDYRFLAADLDRFYEKIIALRR